MKFISRGDSGGPLGFTMRINQSLQVVQFGIVSGGLSSCGGNESTSEIAVRVQNYMDWILENIEE